MAFSFNWAGVNIPKIDAQPKSAANEIAANLGKAQWGSVVRDANNEYADMLASGGSVAEEVRKIQAEIARLEARNDEIRAAQETAREQALRDQQAREADEQARLRAQAQENLQLEAQRRDAARAYNLGLEEARIRAMNSAPGLNGMEGYRPAPDIPGYSQYMQGAANMLAALNAPNYRTR